MPKKYNKNQFNKPATSVHPSLSPPRLPVQNGPNTTTSSVNDILHHLRRTHISSPTSSDRGLEATNVPTVHPTLKAILQFPDILPPRPRNPYSSSGLVSRGGRRVRGPPGPPAPRSWSLMDSIHAPKALKDARKRAGNGEFNKPHTVDRLPGIFIPEERSLIHQTLRALARNWHWHVAYDQHYLATLPIRYKETLLSYIAVYNRGTTIYGLDILFLDETELEGATGSAEVKYLDLASSVGGTLSFKELKDFMSKSSPVSTAKVDTASDLTSPSSSARKSGSLVPESWEDDTPPPYQGIIPLSPRFPTLTHLSLSHSPYPSWRSLLSIAPHLTTLTHLSLAYWPTPSLTPNSRTASTTTPVGNVRYGGSDFYSTAVDNDWNETVSVLRRLGRATLCLKWLDLEGCDNWTESLSWRSRDRQLSEQYNGLGGVGWNEHWRGIETLRLGQGWVPHILKARGEVSAISLLTARIRLQFPPRQSPIVPSDRQIENFKLLALSDERRIALRDLQEWCEVELAGLRLQREIRELRSIGKEKQMVFERGYEGDEEVVELLELLSRAGGFMRIDLAGFVWS